MEFARKIILFVFPFACLSCTTMGSISLLEVKPLPREVVIEVPVEYEPIYAILKIREVSEENGVQKYIFAKLDKDIPEVKAGSLGEISADVSFGEVIGTFKVISKSGGFVNCLIENLTHRIHANSYIRIQTGQKAKEK